MDKVLIHEDTQNINYSKDLLFIIISINHYFFLMIMFNFEDFQFLIKKEDIFIILLSFIKMVILIRVKKLISAFNHFPINLIIVFIVFTNSQYLLLFILVYKLRDLTQFSIFEFLLFLIAFKMNLFLTPQLRVILLYLFQFILYKHFALENPSILLPFHIIILTIQNYIKSFESYFQPQIKVEAIMEKL